jgi:hypothetical protein
MLTAFLLIHGNGGSIFQEQQSYRERKRAAVGQRTWEKTMNENHSEHSHHDHAEEHRQPEHGKCGTAVTVLATLVKGDLMGIAKAIHLSRAIMRNIRQNLFFAFVYNALVVPIAAGGLYPFFGVILSPIIAGAAMSFSSLSVVANALRLRSVRIEPKQDG